MANVRNAAYSLLSNATATGQGVTVAGGRYVWTINSSNWNGATATLQALGADGSTQMTVATATADGVFDLVAGQDATLKVAISGGPPTAVYSNLRGVM